MTDNNTESDISKMFRWDISEYPLSTGRKTQTVDWTTHLAGLPDRVRILKAKSSPQAQ